MRRRTQIIVAVLFIGVLFAPMIVGMFGYQPKQIENRRLFEFPAASEIFSDPEFLDRVRDALLDHLPLRAELVTAGAWVDMAIFNHSYNQFVAVGRDGWLFSKQEVYDSCADLVPPKVDGIKRMGDALARLGIQLVFATAPNKAAIYPEKLTALMALANECLVEQRAEMRKLMADRTGTYFVDLWSVLLAMKSATPRPLYLTLDTHWGPTGAAIASKAVVDRLHPGLWDDADLVVSPPIMTLGNLTYMNGQGLSEPVQSVSTARPGVTVTHTQMGDGEFRVESFKASSSGPYLIPGRTVLLRDSFFERTMDLLPPYFEEITFISDHFRYRPETFELIAKSDTFILALVEHTISGSNWYYTPEFQRQIEEAAHQNVGQRR